MAESTAHCANPVGQPVESGRLDRAIVALRDEETFDRAQLAWLMAQAMRWGYDLGYERGQRDELGLATVAAAYAHTGSFTAENTAREVKKAAYRRECDAAAKLPRPGDYRPARQDDGQVAA
jgi:hypothetical protein